MAYRRRGTGQRRFRFCRDVVDPDTRSSKGWILGSREGWPVWGYVRSCERAVFGTRVRWPHRDATHADGGTADQSECCQWAIGACGESREIIGSSRAHRSPDRSFEKLLSTTIGSGSAGIDVGVPFCDSRLARCSYERLLVKTGPRHRGAGARRWRSRYERTFQRAHADADRLQRGFENTLFKPPELG